MPTEPCAKPGSSGRRWRRFFRATPAPATTNDLPPVTPGGGVAVATRDEVTCGAGAVVPARKWITAALMLVMVLASLEATVTSTAMPTIIGDLHGLEHYSWVASIYLLASTVVMPLYGRLADVLGRKRVMVFAIGMFALGSILAAFSRSMGQLILFRGIQGLGAGGIMPVVLTILGDIFTLEERARIQGIFSAVWGTSALAGPAMGAFLVKTLGWPSVFWVNLPAGLAGLAMLLLKYHDHRRPHSTDLDLFGVTTLAIGSTALLAAVSLMAGVQISPVLPLALLAVSLVALPIFVRHELKAANPVMSPELMMRPSIGPSMAVSVSLGVLVFAVDTYLPLYVQGGRGGDASAAAATVTPVMLAWSCCSIMAVPLMVRLGFRKMATMGSILALAGLVGLLATAWTGSRLMAITGVLFVTGCGFGPTAMSSLLSAQEAVAWQQRGSITSGITFFRNFGGAMGVGVLGMLFNVLTGGELRRDLAGQFPVSDLLNPDRLADLQRSHPELLAAAQGTISHGLLWVFVAMVFIAAAQVGLARLIRPDHQSRPVSTAEALACVD